MHIHIIGGTGSGKTTLSKTLAKKHELKILELDDFYWLSKEDYTKKQTHAEMCNTFRGLVKDNNNYITEGCYYECIEQLLESADKIIFLNPKFCVRRRRIYLRFIKTKLGLIKSKRKPTLKGVKSLCNEAKSFNEEYVKIVTNLLKSHINKTTIITNKKELNNFLKGE